MRDIGNWLDIDDNACRLARFSMKIALHLGVRLLRKFSGCAINEMAGPAELLERPGQSG